MGLEQLFWSTYYEKDASILVQDVLFQALKQTKVVEEEVKKLQTVPQVINKGIETLNQTLCPDCKSKLLDETSPPQGSITKKKDSKTIKRLPIECQSVIKQMEILLIKKERLNKEGDDGEEYGTTEEWYQQTISDLRVQHERDVKGLRREVDQLKREAVDAKRREQELEERYEKKDADLQKSIDSYKISMVTKNRTIENMEADRTSDRLRIKRLKNDIKILDKRIIELSHPNPQEKSTQTELSNLNPQIKSTQTEPQQEKKSYSLFGGGVSKDELNAERIENEKLRNSYRRILQQREQAEKALQEKNNQLVQLNQFYRDQTKQITDLQSKIEELNILKEENAKLHSNIQNAKEKERKTEAALQEKNIELARLQAWKEELNILKEENAKLHSDIQNAKEKERKTEAALQEKNFELERVHSQLDKIQNENTNLDANLQHKAEEQQKEKKQLDDSRQEIQHLLFNLNVRDDKLKSLETEKCKLDSQMEHVRQEKQNLQTKLDDLNTKMAGTESELQTTKTENETLADKLNARDAKLKTLETEKGKLVSQMEHVRQETENLRTKLDDLNTKMAGTESELQTTKTENKTLADNLRSLDAELKDLKTEKNKHASHMERMKREKQHLETKLNDLDVNMRTMESELEKTKTENKNLANGQRAQEDDLKSLRTEKVKLDSHLERAKQEKQHLETELDDLNAQIMEMKSELEKTKTENKNLADSQRIRDVDLKSLRTEKVKLDSHLERAKQEKHHLETNVDTLNAQILEMKSELEKTKAELADSKNQQRDKIEELKIPKKKEVVLGLRSERNGLEPRLVDMVTTELTRRLQQRLDMFSLNLTISFSQTPSDVTNGLQVVLCKSIPGTGTSIPDTLKGLKGDRDMFVLVLHFTTEKNLSSLTPTSHRVTGSEQLGGILDMACSNQRGLYNCDFNNSAVDKIASIIRKFVVL